MTDLHEWLARKARQDDHLYERYGTSLEADHTGEYVAIGADGQTVVGASAAEVLRRAVDTFGSGNFALKRVGHPTFGRWLTVST